MAQNQNGKIGIKNDALENMLGQFKTDQSKANLDKLLAELKGVIVLQPAVLPPGTAPETLKKLASGGMKMDASLRPQPLVIKNGAGDSFFPVFTGEAQLPKDQKYPIILSVPCVECAKVALRPEVKLSGIVINPFTDNIVLKVPALEVITGKTPAPQPASPAVKEVVMTEQQIHTMVKDQVILKLLPQRLYEEKNAFMDRLLKEKEAIVIDMLKTEYTDHIKGKKLEYPYEDSEYESMALNMSDTMQMVRIALPPRNRKIGSPVRILMFFNPSSGEAIYFVVRVTETGKPSEIGYISADGSYTALGDAPAEGEELYTLMDKVPWAQN